MSRKRKTARIVKPADHDGAGAAGEVVADQLEALAREGAREMLMTALGDEVDAYLGRGRYERGDGFRGYRNGTTPRRLTLGSGTLENRVRPPLDGVWGSEGGCRGCPVSRE